jgi:hypothetical protein
MFFPFWKKDKQAQPLEHVYDCSDSAHDMIIVLQMAKFARIQTSWK